ncbi:hypothetical protein HYW75_06120 [Candidatus Pacearchaeota archaeon]|nr:hypothetical protein [Candidatus Pacearchaeota archaeon]
MKQILERLEGTLIKIEQGKLEYMNPDGQKKFYEGVFFFIDNDGSEDRVRFPNNLLIHQDRLINQKIQYYETLDSYFMNTVPSICVAIFEYSLIVLSGKLQGHQFRSKVELFD